MKRAARTEESLAAIRAKLKAFYSDPDNLQRHREKMRRPATRKKISERTAAAMALPEVKARQHDGLMQAWADPARRGRQAEITKERIAAHRFSKPANLPKVDQPTAAAPVPGEVGR